MIQEYLQRQPVGVLPPNGSFQSTKRLSHTCKRTTLLRYLHLTLSLTLGNDLFFNTLALVQQQCRAHHATAVCYAAEIGTLCAEFVANTGVALTAWNTYHNSRDRAQGAHGPYCSRVNELAHG